MSLHKRYLSAAILCFLLLCVVGGVYVSKKQTSEETSETLVNQQSFTNPLTGLSEDESKPLLNREVIDLKEAIEKETSNSLEKKYINKASVYYRDLNNGPWFSIGEENTFRAASLLKIPLMIAIYKDAETDPSILEKKVTYEKAFEHVVQHNVDSSNKTIELGKTYTIDELVEAMIIYSDNLAAYLLLQHIDPKHVEEVFTDLALEVPDGSAKTEITAQKYSTFLRVLYNASYLNKDYSEKALELLSRTTFSHGMRSVIPPETRASIKYGIAADEVLDEKQLHECGVIYWSKDRPHMLCIMTTGDDYLTMASYIKNVTALVQAAVLREGY